MKQKTLIKISFLVFLFCFPIFSFSALELEQRYPKVGEIQLTKYSSLADIIKYFFYFFIIIAGAIVLFSLIVAGVRYISSTGRPELLRSAKNQLANAIFGLIIILTSYLILKIVNPQITITKVERISYDSGILLLTEEGKNEISGKPIKQLLDEKKVYLLVSSQTIKDAKDKFKEFIWKGKEKDQANPNQEIAKVNFKDFEWNYIGFLGSLSENWKVLTYPEKDFKPEGKRIEYSIKEGVIKVETDEELEKDCNFTKIINNNISVCGFKLQFFLGDNVQYKKNDSVFSGRALFPPLSLRITGTGPGVYLTDEKGREIYFAQSVEDLGLFDFNDKAYKIELKNRPQNEYDFIVSLHEDMFHSGQLRLFFERKKRNWVPQKEGDGSKQADCQIIRIDNNELDPLKDITCNFEGKKHFSYRLENGIEVGNITSSPAKIDFRTKLKIDPFGRVNKASSLWIEELSSEINCTKVEICTQPFRKGNCITYSKDEGVVYTILVKDEQGNVHSFEIKEKDTVWPIYFPRNIPKKLSFNLKEITINNKKFFLPGEVEFRDNIWSLYLEPENSCLVALYDHSVNEEECLECNTNWEWDKLSNSCNECWDGDTPGKHSELFKKSVLNLKGHQINQCAGNFGYTGGGGVFARVNPCASSIAIFPIKRKE